MTAPEKAKMFGVYSGRISFFQPIQIFRRIARLVRMLCSVCMAIQSYAIGKGLMDSYLVSIAHKAPRKTSTDEDDMEELTFNLQDFKVRKEVRTYILDGQIKFHPIGQGSQPH